MRDLATLSPVRLPWVSLGCALLVLGVAQLPEPMVALLSADRAAIASGQLWRLLTGHWTHFGSAHAWVNAAALLVWGSLVERQHRRLMLVNLGVGLFALGGLVYALCPDTLQYRGASGLAALLLAQVVWFILLDSELGRVRKCLTLLVAALLLLKMGWGASKGLALTGITLAPGVHVVYAAHVYGALLGLVLGLCTRYDFMPGRASV